MRAGVAHGGGYSTRFSDWAGTIANEMSLSRRTSPTNGLGALALFLVTSASWVLAPALVRHQAAIEPLFHETVPLAGSEPAGGFARRAILDASPLEGGWAARFVEVREEGRPLARGRPQAVRSQGGGRFSVSESGEILFAPIAPAAGDGIAPDPRAFTVRRPRSISAALAGALAAALVALTSAMLAWMARGLARSRILRPLVLAVAIGLAGWLAAQAAIRKLVPWTGSDLLGQKMSQFLDGADTYRAVFIGSSRVYRQLEPDAFDAVFAESGVAMRSFNLGAPDMRMLEVLFLARWLLDAEPRRLELLVVDAESDPLSIREVNLRSDRIVRWHDPRNFAAILREVRRSSPTRAAALYRAGRHAAPFVHHVTRLGRGIDRAAMLASPRPPEAPLEDRGFHAGDEEMVASPSETQRRDLEMFHRRLHGDLDRWRRDVERMTRSPRAGALSDPFEIELFEELGELAAGRGVRVVFLIDARPQPTPNLVWAAERGIVETLLRFDDPERYPVLYDPALRFDRHHVNRAGARVYSAEVARRILELERARS